MERIVIEPRADWQEKVEEIQFNWHTSEEGQYWDESAYYRFTSDQIDKLEEATETAHQLFMSAAERVIEAKQLALFGYDQSTIEVIERSWYNRSHHPTLYGRFDFAWDGTGQPKVLEYNGDTPTSLYEAGVVQWAWMEEQFPDADQFNSIHDKFVEALKKLKFYESAKLRGEGDDLRTLYLTCVTPHPEDEGTIAYIQRMAEEAGLPVQFIALTDIGWRSGDTGLRDRFVDLRNRPIQLMFKLVPWEWLLDDPFGQKLASESVGENIQLVEPAWKMVVANKRLLETVWEMFPHHPYLLQASMNKDAITGDKVKKPILGREGANIAIIEGGAVTDEQPGLYTEDQFIYQKKADLFYSDGNYAVLGSWVIDGKAAGLGMRESTSRITNNMGRFVPHIFE